VSDDGKHERMDLRREEWHNGGRLVRSPLKGDAAVKKDIVSIDYCSLERRMMSLVDNHVQNSDYHKAFASELQGVPMEEVTPTGRRVAKAIHFGVQFYGSK
jgi:DNA polymerase I-like protein with 3'-5' exonuclease and polymerase domains